MPDAAAQLADARLYLCTDARKRQGDLPRFLDAVLAGGVDIVQLRDKGMEAAEELEHLQVFADACRRHGKLLAVNDRADVAHAIGADVLHLGQGDLRHEPRSALVGGPDGLDAIREIARGAAVHLAPGGRLLLEHGLGQDAAVRQLLEDCGLEGVMTWPDLAGIARVTGGRLKS